MFVAMLFEPNTPHNPVQSEPTMIAYGETLDSAMNNLALTIGEEAFFDAYETDNTAVFQLTPV